MMQISFPSKRYPRILFKPINCSIKIKMLPIIIKIGNKSKIIMKNNRHEIVILIKTIVKSCQLNTLPPNKMEIITGQMANKD